MYHKQHDLERMTLAQQTGRCKGPNLTHFELLASTKACDKICLLCVEEQGLVSAIDLEWMLEIATFRQQVLEATEHLGGIRMLPCLSVDPSWFREIQKDVTRLIEELRPSVVDESHPTYWVNPYGKAVQYSLFNSSGSTADTTIDTSRENKAFVSTGYASLYRFFSLFEQHVLTFRLNGMMPHSGLSPHEESIVDGEKIRLRFHLPVFTNEKASVALDQRRFWLQEGYVYYFNNGCVHAADNDGEVERYHLVWDQWLSDWAFDNLLDLASPSTPDADLHKLSPAKVEELSRSENRPMEEYVIGKPTGEVVKVSRQDRPKNE
jgi:hypothetical protein